MVDRTHVEILTWILFGIGAISLPIAVLNQIVSWQTWKKTATGAEQAIGVSDVILDGALGALVAIGFGVALYRILIQEEVIKQGTQLAYLFLYGLVFSVGIPGIIVCWRLISRLMTNSAIRKEGGEMYDDSQG